MPSMALRHIALRTRNLEKTRCFYVDQLGLREAFTHPGMLFLETPRGRDLLNFIETRKPLDPGAGGLDHFGIHVAPRRFAALRKRLKTAGVKVVGRRGRVSIYVKDPNGYTLELYAD